MQLMWPPSEDVYRVETFLPFVPIEREKSGLFPHPSCASLYRVVKLSSCPHGAYPSHEASEVRGS